MTSSTPCRYLIDECTVDVENEFERGKRSFSQDSNWCEMSVFGDLETPKGDAPQPQLADLSVKVYGAVFDPVTNDVDLHGQAKVSFDDGSAGPGTAVAFFLNGKLVAKVKADDFGLAELRQKTAKESFCDGDNEIIARVAGYAKEARAEFALQHKQINFVRVAHRWQRVITCRYLIMGSDSWHGHQRLERLTIQAQASSMGCRFPLNGIKAEVQTLGKAGHYRTLASATLDARGFCHLVLNDTFAEPTLSGASSISYSHNPARLAEENNLFEQKVILCAPGWPKSEYVLNSREGGESYLRLAHQGELFVI